MEREEEFELDVGGAKGAPVGGGQAGAEGAGAGRVRTGPSRARGPAPWLVLGAVLILAGVAAAPAPPRAQIGIVDHLGDPAEQWRTDFEVDSSPMNTGGLRPPEVWLADDAVIVVRADRIEALQGEDGTRLWDAEGDGLQCQLSDPAILCASGSGSEAELLRLHATDGEIDRSPHPGLRAALDIEGDLLAIRNQGEETVVSREGPDGQEVWSYQLDTGSPRPSGPGYGEQMSLAVDLVADQVLLVLAMGTRQMSAAIDANTGAAQDIDDGVLLFPLMRWPTQTWAMVDEEGRIVGSIGDDGYPSAIHPGLMVDDDTESDLTFERDQQTLSAVSRSTGVEAWTRSQGGEAPVPFARIGDVLVVTARGNLIGLDLDTGQALWSHDWNPWHLAWSDGQVLAYPEHRDGSRVVVTAIEAETGERVFQVDMGQGIGLTVAMDKPRLALLTDESLSLWTW